MGNLSKVLATLSRDMPRTVLDRTLKVRARDVRHFSALTASGFAALLVTLAGVATLAAPPAQARVVTHDLNIPPQDLGEALKALSAAADEQLLFSEKLVTGKRSGKVAGKYTSEQALDILLKGSGLKADRAPSGVLLIRPSTSTTSTATSESAAQERKKEKSQHEDGFRVAQADQGTSAGVATVENETERASEQRPAALEEVIVTAQKREERLHDVPISVSVLTGADLDKSTVQGVADALNTVPGVATFTSNLGGGTQVIIRGVTAPDVLYDGPSPIGYYLDSVPFALIRGAVAPDANAYDLDRVEVLRGPQGDLYGAGSLNGVVRIITRDPDLREFDLKARASASTTEGGAGNYRGDMMINVPLIDDKLAVRGVVGEQDLSGWVNSPVKTHVNDGNLHNYRLKIGAAPVDNLSIVLSGARSLSNFGAPPTSREDRAISALGDQPYSIDYDAYALNVDYQLSHVSISSKTSLFSFYNEGTLDVYPLNYSDQSGPPQPFFSLNNARTLSEDFVLNSRNTTLWTWSVGALYRDDKERAVQNFEVPAAEGGGPQVGEHLTSRSYAVFGELGQRLFDDTLEWTAGLRKYHDEVTDQGDPDVPGQSYARVSNTFQRATPRAVLTWRPSRDHMAYVSYSEGFRSGWPQQPSVVLSAPEIPVVKPDFLRNYELGTKHDLFGHRMSVDTAVYYIQWKDIQQGVGVFVDRGNFYQTAGINGNSASGAGADFSAIVRPLDRLELSAYFSWNDLKFDNPVISFESVLYAKGSRVALSPLYTGGASAAYTFPLHWPGVTGQVGGSYNYISALPENEFKNFLDGTRLVYPKIQDPLKTARAYVALDTSKHWNATLYVDNLTNYYGSQRSSDSPPDWSTRPRPRTIGIQLDYRFK